MTINAKRFEVCWVISPILAQLKRMMAMGLIVMELISAVLADALIPLVDPLLKGFPEINRHPAKPGEL